MQKYPTRTKRYVSKAPTCCRQRNGLVKAKFPTQETANKHRVGDQEAYLCRQKNGWHLRTKRN